MNTVNQSASRSNRADQMRQRKEQQSTNRTTVAARRAVSEPERPLKPVTVRNTTFGTPIRQRVATTNPRRQYYLSLDTPGTELRLPALPVIRLGSRGLSAVIAILCLIGIFSLLFSPVFTVSIPKITGMKRLTQTNVESALNIENRSIIELNATELTAALMSTFPLLESANVSVSLPNTISVTIKERQPMVAWQIGDKTLWIDSKGVLFPQVGDAPGLLTITADSQPPVYISPDELKSIEEAQKKAAAVGTPEAQAAMEITLKNIAKDNGPDRIDPALLNTALKLAAYFPGGMALAYSDKHGIGWQDPGGWEVYIGKDLKEFNQKYALYQSISQQLAGQSITPAIISVEFLDAPYYRLEK